MAHAERSSINNLQLKAVVFEFMTFKCTPKCLWSNNDHAKSQSDCSKPSVKFPEWYSSVREVELLFESFRSLETFKKAWKMLRINLLWSLRFFFEFMLYVILQSYLIKMRACLSTVGRGSSVTFINLFTLYCSRYSLQRQTFTVVL